MPIRPGTSQLGRQGGMSHPVYTPHIHVATIRFHRVERINSNVAPCICVASMDATSQRGHFESLPQLIGAKMKGSLAPITPFAFPILRDCRHLK